MDTGVQTLVSINHNEIILSFHRNTTPHSYLYRIISYCPVFHQDQASLKTELCISLQIDPFITLT